MKFYFDLINEYFHILFNIYYDIIFLYKSIISHFKIQYLHYFVEFFAVTTIIYLLSHKSKKTRHIHEILTLNEKEELIKEWKPVDLVPELDKVYQYNKKKPHILEGAVKAVVTLDNKQFLNFASFNFLGLADSIEVKEASEAAIRKYGVGACGPRAFYGTIDVHLEFEQRLAKYFNVNDVCVYSDGLSTMSSIIPLHAKKRDFILCDESVHSIIRHGLILSRCSNVIFFKHNGMNHLKSLLVQYSYIPDNIKKFIIVEGLYLLEGDICPLNEIMKLKKQYTYRLILDDSMAIGVLGKTGRGSLEYWNISHKEIDVYAATLDASFAIYGGFVFGIDEEVIVHNRCASSGYLFSASAPPYVSAAGIEICDLIDLYPEKLVKLNRNSSIMYNTLLDVHPKIKLYNSKSSPIFHLRLITNNNNDDINDEDIEHETSLCYLVRDELAEKYNICVGVQIPLPIGEKTFPSFPRSSIRITVSADHSSEQIESLNKPIREIYAKIFKKLGL